jgi:hypothetical protein
MAINLKLETIPNQEEDKSHFHSPNPLHSTYPLLFKNTPAVPTTPNNNGFVKYQGIENYVKKKILGEGATGQVHLVIHKKSQEAFALK